MKRNAIFISILMLILGTFPVGQVNATAPDYSDYWTLEEILTTREEAKQEVLGYCYFSEEPDCMERYHVEYILPRGSKYQAADSMNAFRYLVTAVNPAQNTVRVMFFEDDMSMTYTTGELYDDNIDELIMVWFDLGFLGYNFYDEYHAGALPSKTHLLFARDNLAESFPPREEVTLELESDVSENYRNMIYYFFVTESGNRYMDPIDYTSCVEHPFYREGMECRLFYGKEEGGNPIYLPVEITTNTDDVLDETEPEENQPDVPGQITEKKEQEVISDVPFAPNTGVKTECERKIEFPWWIILLIAAGEILTIWCLLPNYQKFKKNNEKKS